MYRRIKVNRRIEQTAFWILVAALVIGFSLPAAPLLFRMFVPFPSLDQTQHLVGSVEVEFAKTFGRSGGGPLARIYVITSEGKVEVDCGYMFDRRTCHDFNSINGSQGQIWYHPIHGVVQWRLTNAKTGKVSEIDIQFLEEYRRKNFSPDRYIEKLWVPIALLVAAFFLSRSKQHSSASH
jgi:hypothetical protein